MANNKLSLQDKLLTKTKQVGECLVWVGQKARGYGKIKIGGKKIGAHTVHYELHNGKIPKGKVLMHSCDNPACINLDHLSIGTQLDNIRDMLAKNRGNKAFGERCGRAKLTMHDVIEIRRRFSRGSRQDGVRALAREYSVSHPSILAIVNRETWTRTSQ